MKKTDEISGEHNNESVNLIGNDEGQKEGCGGG